MVDDATLQKLIQALPESYLEPTPTDDCYLSSQALTLMQKVFPELLNVYRRLLNDAFIYGIAETPEDGVDEYRLRILDPLKCPIQGGVGFRQVHPVEDSGGVGVG